MNLDQVKKCNRLIKRIFLKSKQYGFHLETIRLTGSEKTFTNRTLGTGNRLIDAHIWSGDKRLESFIICQDEYQVAIDCGEANDSPIGVKLE
jgi:hypothetical protein